MSVANGGEPPFEVGMIDRQAPYPPAQEHTLNASVTDFTRMPDGSMLVHFTPVTGTKSGFEWDTPTITVVFDPDSWETFKGRVAQDGKRGIVPHKPRIIRP